jgi:hypothetical protein
VDWVPGLPGVGTPASPPPAPRRDRAPRPSAARRESRSRLAGLGLVAAAVALLEAGLVLRFGAESLWHTVPTWSTFATVTAALGAVPFLLRGAGGLTGRGVWQVGAAGTVGVAVFWVLVVLPDVATNRGFVLTVALGLLAGAVWLAPGRTR